MVIQAYDGLVDFNDVQLQSLFFWVRLENIPPRLETPTVIEDASIVAGDDPYVDLNLLNSTGEVRVRVSHALDKPFIFDKVLKLALGIVKNVVFFYENLVAICASCKLIYHLDGICKKKVAKSVVQEPQKENWVEALVNLTNLNYSQDSLKFTGVQSGVAMSSILKPIQPQMPSKSLTRKLIVIKKSLLGFKVTKRPVLVEIGTNGLEPAGNEDDVPAMSLELLLVFTDVQPIDQAMQEPKDTPLSCVSKNCNLNSSQTLELCDVQGTTGMAEIASTPDSAIVQFVATQGVHDVFQEGTIPMHGVMNPSSLPTPSELNSAAKTTSVVTEVVKDPSPLIPSFVDLIQVARLEKPNTDRAPKVSTTGAVKHHRLSKVE